MSTRKRRFYQTDWFWWLFFGALVSPFFASACGTWWAIHRHGPVRDKMELAILRLSLEGPKGVSEAEWAYCIMWTSILQGNFGSMGGHVPTDELDGIADELNRKIDEGADIETINWIWDQYILAYPRASRYSDSYRPTLPRGKAEVETHKDSGQSEYALAFWRERYRQKLAELK